MKMPNLILNYLIITKIRMWEIIIFPQIRSSHWIAVWKKLVELVNYLLKNLLWNWEISKNIISENLTKRLNEIKWTPDVRKPSTAKKNSRKSMRFTKIFLLMSKFLKPFLQHIKLELWTKYKFNFHSSKIPIKLIFRRFLIWINYLHLYLRIFIYLNLCKNTILLN